MIGFWSCWWCRYCFFNPVVTNVQNCSYEVFSWNYYSWRILWSLVSKYGAGITLKLIFSTGLVRRQKRECMTCGVEEMWWCEGGVHRLCSVRRGSTLPVSFGAEGSQQLQLYTQKRDEAVLFIWRPVPGAVQKCCRRCSWWYLDALTVPTDR